MREDNKIVQGLWIGNWLSPIELLTLHSFTQHGHIFHLWVYESIENELPPNVLLQDANEIIPFDQVFKKKKNDPTNNLGANSFAAPFSDLFRYKLLYEKGGWWVDMDVTCLKPFDFEAPYFFRAHPILPMVGNVLKCPPKSELMERAFEETNRRCDENTEDWLLPNRILNTHVEQLKLTSFIQGDLSNEDNWEEVKGLIYQDEQLPSNWHFLHWMNEEWRSQELDKSEVYYASTLARLLQQYRIDFTSKSSINGRSNWLARKTFRESPLYPVYKWMKSKTPIH